MANTTYSTSQTATYTATGTLDEDISSIITNISPSDTPFLSTFKAAEDATELDFSWFLEALKPPRENMHLEMEDYTTESATGLGRKKNTIQFFRRSAKVSDAMKQVNKLYEPKDEMSRQMTLQTKQLAMDMEYAFVHNDISRLESGSIPAMTGGVPYFMEEDIIVCAFANSKVTVTLDAAHTTHGLSTGDFVMFKADSSATLPSEISTNKRYYVRLDATTPTTTFTLHKTIEGAVSNSQQVTFSAGSGYVLLNNIVDAGDALFTEDNINDALELIFYRGGNPSIAYMSGRNKRRFSQIMHNVNDVNRNQQDSRVVNTTSVYEGDFGTIKAQTHRLYPEDVIDIMDMSMWALKWFGRPHQRELPLKGSYEERIIEGSIGLKGTQPLASARIINVKAS